MIGRTLSHYTITGLLGRGGMGEVYRARDEKLQREVALKVLPDEMARHPMRLSRFTREAQIVAGLNHPNIVTLHSVDEADGLHFLTMELVEGETLAERMPADGLPLEQLLEIAVPIADALATAHAGGVVHRDLKPANVMLTRDGGRIKVLDFGLARLAALGDEESSDSIDTRTMTQAGVVVGTPFYMSPEQARGQDTDSRTDLFSLGVMLYEMATGRRPFRGESTADLMSALLRDDPEPVETIRPGLPAGLQTVLDRCLAKSPADRYATAEQLRDDLRLLQAGSGPVPVAPPPPPATPPRRMPWRRVLPALAALVVIASAAWWAGHPAVEKDAADKGRIVAVLPFENLGAAEDEYFADGVTDEITSRLAVLEGMGVISRTSARQYAGSDKSLRRIGEELGADYLLEGTIRWERAGDRGRVRISPRLIRVSNDTQIWTDSYDREVTEIFALQAEIASRIAEALDITLVDRERRALATRPTGNIEAYHAYLQGMKELYAPGFDREAFERGVRLFERAVQLDPQFALAYARLSSMHSRLYHYGFDRAENRLQMAKAAADRALELRPDLAEAYLALGHYYYWGRRDYDQALEALQNALLHAPNLGEVLLNTAYVKRRQGDFGAALEYFERYRVLSPMDPNVFVGLGETNATLRRYAEAERAYRRATTLPPADPYPYTELALLYLRWRGDVPAAREALAAAPPQSGGEGCRVGFLVDLLGRDYESARERLDLCSDAVLEAGAFYTPTDLFRGELDRLEERPDEAQAAFEAARLHLDRQLAGQPDDPRLHSALGIALAGLGQREEAVEHGRRAVELLPVSDDALAGPIQIIHLAWIHTLVGDADAAVRELETVLAMPSVMSTAWLRIDPRWDALRDDAGFEELLRRYEAAAGD